MPLILLQVRCAVVVEKRSMTILLVVIVPVFLNFGEAVKIIDPYTKELRKGTREDVANITRFVDSMDPSWML